MRWWQRKSCERDLDRELRTHLELEAEERQDSGLSPEQALDEARRAFGNTTLVKEEIRDVWGWASIDRIWQDLRHGARGLRRQPGFSIAAVLSLALGIGVTTALFMVLNAVALRPLPYTDPARLVWMTQLLHGSSTDEITITADFLDLRRLNHSFTDLAGYNHQVRTLTGVDPSIEVRTVRCSASLLSLLGIAPAIGRDFLRQEDLAGSDGVTILGYEFWQREFGGNRSILGRSITLDGRQFSVIGVLPQAFIFPGADPVDLLTPLGKDEGRELQRGQYVTVIFDVLGRLRSGVTLDQAHAELTAIQTRLPNFLPWRPQITIQMRPLHEHLFGDAARTSFVFVGSGCLPPADRMRQCQQSAAGPPGPT